MLLAGVTSRRLTVMMGECVALSVPRALDGELVSERHAEFASHVVDRLQRADDLFVTLHQLSTRSFPTLERFELGAQLRKAAYSVPANIAEGFARRQPRDRRHFLNVAESSLAEVSYCIHVAHRLGYITAAVYDQLGKEAAAVGAPLVGLIRSIQG